MPTGKTKDAGWQIGVQTTVARPVDDVWARLVAPPGVDRWLGSGARLSGATGEEYETDDGTTGEVRSFRPGDRVRVTYRPPDAGHETTVQVAVEGKGSKTTVRFHQERLFDAKEGGVKHHPTGGMGGHGPPHQRKMAGRSGPGPPFKTKNARPSG